MRTLILLIIGSVCLLANPASAQSLRLAPAFQSHMVLQRNTMLSPIWGRATPNSTVTIEASWTKKVTTVTTGADGRWSTTLTTGNPGGPFQLTVRSSEGDEIALEDVLIGEVWICSGQSNMEWPMHLVDGGAEAIASADRPNIRLMTVERTVAPTAAFDVDARWARCTPESVRDFSAAGLFFGMRLSETLDMPIGLISTNWGGTPVEAWTSAESLAPFDEFASTIRDVRLIAMDPAGAEMRLKQRWAEWTGPIDRQDEGMIEGWSAPEFDDSSWKTLDVPGGWNRSPDLQGFDGAVWYRRSFEIPEDWGDQPLEVSLGPIDDMDRVFVNGRRIAVTERDGQWAVPRKYLVRARLSKPGVNTIAIRIIDTRGGGGLYGEPGQIFVRPNGSDEAPVTLTGTWRYRKTVPASRFGPQPQALLNSRTPSALFNGMIAPLAPLSVRGAIWYQGESNVGRAAQYERVFPAMIEDWRRAFSNPEMPFYYVQIAPFEYGWVDDNNAPALLREAQRRTMTMPFTGMAVTMDIGDPRDIHPTNKHDVGDRLARWALADTYNIPDVVKSGPVFRFAFFEDGVARLSFDHATPSLQTRDGEPVRDLWVAGEDRVFRPATVTIEGDVLIASHPKIEQPVAVRYGWPGASMPNLCNGAGLPASSFRSDDWDGAYVFKE